VSPEARAAAHVLLDHHRRFCRSRSAESSNFDLCLISYGELCERAGISHLKPTLGKFLREIAQWCHENGWPPLNSLAVNHETRMPGHGYDQAPGCSLIHWREEVEASIEFDGYPETKP
jgi:hypothetical protein